MYCSYCGKEIPDDSNYCKYCGQELVHPLSGHKDSIANLIEKFKSLSMKKQILIICYILWFMLWFCVVLANGDEHRFVSDVLFPGLLYGVIMPIAIFCIWYIISIVRKRRHENSVQSPIKDVIKLVDFAKEMGQMKIIKKDVGLPTENVYYAFVKKGIVTAEVKIEAGMPNFSAEEISKQKDSLYIKRISLGKYELVFLPKP
jgi:uncharacterized membrane protein (DUF485 family)